MPPRTCTRRRGCRSRATPRTLASDTDLAAWIYTVARNRFVSSRRRTDVARPAADPTVFDRASSGLPADDPGCRDLEQALASLPEIHREVLLLVGVEGLDVAQAAAVLAIRPDAARQRLARARAALAGRARTTIERADRETARRAERKATS